jgi:hypothetical protein
MGSHYAQYIAERTHDHIMESDIGFATYRYLDDGKTVYIIDIYISPLYRRGHEASLLANKIVDEAKAKGCTKVVGSVVPSMKNSTTSLKVLLGYGMTLACSTNDLIMFSKEI